MSELISPIRTLEEWLRFCENYIKSDECSEEQKVIKAKQIDDHKKAIKILQANGVDASENTLPIDNVIVSVCDCTHTQACSVCGESKGIDMRFLDD